MSFLPSNIARNIVHASLRQAGPNYGPDEDLVMLGQKHSPTEAENLFDPGLELREVQAENAQGFIKTSLEMIARLVLITALDDDEHKYPSAHDALTNFTL